MKRRKHSTLLASSFPPRKEETECQCRRKVYKIDLRSTTTTLLTISLLPLLVITLSIIPIRPSNAHRLVHQHRQQHQQYQQQVHRPQTITQSNHYQRHEYQNEPNQYHRDLSSPARNNLNHQNHHLQNQLPSYMNQDANTREELITPESTSLSHNYEPPMMASNPEQQPPVESDVDSLVGPIVESVLSGVDPTQGESTGSNAGDSSSVGSMGANFVGPSSQLEADEQELHRNQPLGQTLNLNQNQMAPPSIGGGGGGLSHQMHSSASNQHDGDATLADGNSPQEMPAIGNSNGNNLSNLMNQHHQSRLKAMHDMFERRQLASVGNPHHAHSAQNQHSLQPHSQELSPISIGLDPSGGFGMPPPPSPFGGGGGGLIEPKVNVDDGVGPMDQGLGPAMPFGLNPLPHLLGFQNAPFDGPQRGDQSAHSNHHTASPSSDSPVDAPVGGGQATGGNQKVWPKIFRFTDGRINLSDFEKQKKIRLSNKNQHIGDNHIESAPIMFDGRQLKRKSFLILHGGIFS